MHKHLGKLKKFNTGLNLSPVVIIALFIVAGLVIYGVSRAAGPFVIAQVSKGSTSGDVARFTDNTASGGTGVKFGQPTLRNQQWPDKRVWAHHIGHGLADYSNMGTGSDNYYGSLYPLDLVYGTASATRRATSGVPRALQAGVTGIQILLFNTNKATDFTTRWVNQADPTWSDSDPNNNFMVSPSLETTTEADTLRIINEWVAYASSHPSAARVNGKLAIYVYKSRGLTPEQWQNVRTQLGTVNNQIYLLGNLSTTASQTGRKLDTTKTIPWFGVFEASWEFDDSVEYIWNDLIRHMNAYSRQFAGGIEPGLDRQTCATDSSCGHIDALGTQRYRNLLDLSLYSGTGWHNIVTWSDMVERTEVQATSNWNITRADVTAFFAAKLRGLPFPKPQAELYITTPEQIKLGESVRAEGLVLNGSGKMVTVRTTLINSSGAAVAPIATADVHPGNDGDASAGLNTSITSFPSGRFLRAKAELIDKATGTVLQQVTSAPIVVYAADANPTFSLHRLYYSIPASKALPGRPTLSLSGNPVTSTTAMATVTAPSGTAVRFNEVIQNTRQVGNGFTVNPYSVSIPMSSRTIIGGQVTNASKDGFYLGRVIDEQERVGYTDPVYVAP